MNKSIISAALVAGLISIWSATTASAQTTAPSPTPIPTPEPTVVVMSNSPQPLLIAGMEVDKTPVGVPVGVNICIEDSVYYKSEAERWTFQGWSNGATQECIAPTRPGTFRALFAHEVLIVVRSAASAFQHSQWVTAGTPLDLEVPAIATVPDDPRSRYRFIQWSDGETPFQPKNTIAPVKPTVLEIKWTFEHQVTVQGPADVQLRGSGWYPDGANLVLQAPESVDGPAAGERLKFMRWEPSDYPAALIGNAMTPQATLKIDAAYSVRAVFQKQYLVTARNPAGTLKRDWFNDGQELILETSPVLDVIPDRERLVFKRWDGVDNILSPRFGGPVDRPVNVAAQYEREVMLKVDAPYGVSGDGWHKAGSVATVNVPASTSSMFLLRSTFAGFSAQSSDASSLQILMNEPVTMSALYRTEVDVRVLAVLLLVPFGAFVVLLSYRWVPALWRRRPRLRSRSAFSSPEQEIRYATHP
jgi:hypothetical protein